MHRADRCVSSSLESRPTLGRCCSVSRAPSVHTAINPAGRPLPLHPVPAEDPLLRGVFVKAARQFIQKEEFRTSVAKPKEEKRKNRACLCTSEPSRSGSVNPFIPGQFGHVTRKHQFISAIPHRLSQNNPPPTVSRVNHDPQCTGTSSLQSIRLSDVVNISTAVSLSRISVYSLWILSMNFALIRQSERPGFQSPSEVGWR